MAVITFNARGSDGRIYKIHRITQEVPAGTFDDPDATFEGLPSFQLSDGRPLNKTGDHTYEVPGGGLELVTSL